MFPYGRSSMAYRIFTVKFPGTKSLVAKGTINSGSGGQTTIKPFFMRIYEGSIVLIRFLYIYAHRL